MKDKNLPNNYDSLSLDELTIEANKMIEEFRKSKKFGKLFRKISKFS